MKSTSVELFELHRPYQQPIFCFYTESSLYITAEKGLKAVNMFSMRTNIDFAKFTIQHLFLCLYLKTG